MGNTKKTLHIIKVGGNIIDNKKELNRFLKDFSKIKEDKILVHGGGKLASQMAKKLNIPQQMLNGRRITDAPTLELITMVYGGLISKNITAILATYHQSALGLSGADAGSITSKIRSKEPTDFGFVGEVEQVYATNISKLLKADFIPVFCPITHDGNGQLLNTNADTMATVIASALNKEYQSKLYYCFEKKGVMKDIKEDNSILPELNLEDYKALKTEGKIFNGMIPKLENAFTALENGVKETYILQAQDLLDLIEHNINHGTRITNNRMGRTL